MALCGFVKLFCLRESSKILSHSNSSNFQEYPHTFEKSNSISSDTQEGQQSLDFKRFI